MNTTPPPSPSPAPKNAPTAKETPAAPSPESPTRTFFAAIFAGMKTPPHWLAILAIFLRLIWPLAILGSGVALFCVIGASGWLWLVLGLIIVCGVFARPPQHPTKDE